MLIGEEFKLEGEIYPLSDNPPFVIWSTNNPQVVTIDKEGLMRAVSLGKAMIIATLSDHTDSDTCIVNVYNESDFDYKFRVTLKDKAGTAFTIDNPEAFLSQKSIERRNKQNIPIHENDLPISQTYMHKIQELGGTIVTQSKWLNTITIDCASKSMADQLKQLSFIKEVKLVWRRAKKENKTDTRSYTTSKFTKELSAYGEATVNIRINNGQVLHNKGYKGEGIDIAVIDAGYENVNKIEAFNQARILGVKSFVHLEEGIYEDSHDHGTEVLSCLAANIPGKFLGTAPAANYWLLRSEDLDTEFPVEEDYWVAAIEYADSVGADVVTTSLGYHAFDLTELDYTYKDMDGKTAHMSRSIDLAVEKGMLVFSSAGNSNSWVDAPGDANLAITVGAIKPDGVTISDESARGITVDGRIKPDILALGVNTAVIDGKGKIMNYNGTSLSTPIIAGLAACLWQAYPTLTSKQLVEIMKQASDRYEKPEVPYGYGVTNMEKAIEIAEIQVAKK